MGVYLAKGAVDEMSYQALSDGGNELTLVKKDCIPTMEEG
jgi:hypothetical protein